ncbi:MAG: Ig-like domain-containing protein [Arenicellales bacterium WSBS_2016_MAG_OTU3]
MRDANDYEVLVLADNTGDVAITVPAGVAMAGTKTNMVSNTLMLPYDHAPTVVLAAAATTAMTDPFTVTATFSEAVTGLEAAEIEITNATVILRALARPTPDHHAYCRWRC